MKLLMAMFIALGAQTLAAATVTGVVRDTEGKPLGGVRVAAMATPETGDNSALLGIAVSDETGHYRIEIPAGSYFIVAGRVDKPTYYPGVRGSDRATVISLTSYSSSREVDLVIFALTGVVRNLKGAPLSDVRVAAFEVPNIEGASVEKSGPTIIGKTDSTGHYRLEVAPGNYYLSAGPTGRSAYYPDATEFRNGRRIEVGGKASNGLDFAISEEILKSRPEDLYLQGIELLAMGSESIAQLRFQTFISTYPENDYIPQAKYALADLLYRNGALTAARKIFEEYVSQFPAEAHVDEAKKKIADIKQKTGGKN